MTATADDVDIDAIEITWRDEQDGPWRTSAIVPVGDDSTRRVLEAFLAVGGEWDDVQLLARCVASRRSVSTDARGVTFASDYYGRSGHVYLSDGTEEPVEIAESAGLRLLARWLRVLADGAERQQLDATTEPTWPDFVSHVLTIEQLAAPAHPDSEAD